MSTPDMATYLLERIAEDERTAQAACARDDVAECEAKRTIVQHCQEVLTHHVFGDRVGARRWDVRDRSHGRCRACRE